MAYKNKSKSRTLTLGKRITMRQNRGKSPNQSQKLWQETNHMEKRKKRNQKPEQGRNKSCGRKKEMDFNDNVSNVSVKVKVISFNKKC